MDPINHSFWQDGAGVAGRIRESTVSSTVADTAMIVKAGAWAMNPADVMIQDTHLPFINYPLVLGEDVAGTVQLCGSTAASKFAVGDRILALAVGAVADENQRGGFREYVVVDYQLTCRIPDSMSFTDASVLPLCISTAAYGPFSRNYLGLPYPTTTPFRIGKSILIWGGGSAVGSNAIQLCAAAGLDVITTCSAHNYDYVKRLGASHVFDYKSPTVVEDVASQLDSSTCAGIFNAVGPVGPSCRVAQVSKQKLSVASTTVVSAGSVLEGVEAKWVFADGGVPKETILATFGAYLPEALSRGTYQIAPIPEVVPIKGLEGIHNALELLRKGVSARKVVVEAA
ncbi:hypothetical protein MMC25_005181 [Agyrium rufum]|nr:hypothetical protein [Agyrium rufum]